MKNYSIVLKFVNFIFIIRAVEGYLGAKNKKKNKR